MAGIRKTRIFNFPIDDVWEALTDPELMAEWLMPNDFKAEIAHEFTFRTKPAPGFDGIVHCKVLKLDIPNEFEITWQGGGADTVLNIKLDDLDGRTRLTLRHDGFNLPGNLVPFMFLRIGWGAITRRNLPKLLEAQFAGRSPK